ncbi:pyridoxamine 5'-phosphate oxidase family protein [Nocardioides sp.]|uniref:pyridoxamine 5'-phosphate oxidase family protein n=1 Tax=Nocardioides sp. TaxID=35761 RepID=UPI003529304E
MEYTAAQRELQDRFDTRRLADRINDLLVHDHLDTDTAAFIERQDMMFVATVDGAGQPTCSYKGGDPGFVRVLDEHTLAFPSYDGNGMFLTLGNTVESQQVGLLFIDFVEPSRVRVHGRATVSDHDPLLEDWPGAQLVVRVTVTQAFPNCPRYLHRTGDRQRSPFVPRTGEAPPVPDWKRADWAVDVLPTGDPALDAPR